MKTDPKGYRVWAPLPERSTALVYRAERERARCAEHGGKPFGLAVRERLRLIRQRLRDPRAE